MSALVMGCFSVNFSIMEPAKLVALSNIDII